MSLERIVPLQPMRSREFRAFLDSPQSPISREVYDDLCDGLQDQPNLSASISYLKDFTVYELKNKDPLLIFSWLNNRLKTVALKDGTDIEDAILNYNLDEQMGFVVEKKIEHPRVIFSLKDAPKMTYGRDDEKPIILPGDTFYSQVFASPMPGKDPLGLIGFVTESKKQGMLKEHYTTSILRRAFRGKFMDQFKITFDVLTGTYNRDYFDEVLATTISNAQLVRKNVGYIICDLNSLKYLNDSYGYDLGTDILKKTGEVLQCCVRSSDVVARVGGDEFKIFLPGISASRLEQKVKLINEKSEEISLAVNGDIRTRPNIACGATLITPTTRITDINKHYVSAEKEMRERKKEWKMSHSLLSEAESINILVEKMLGKGIPVNNISALLQQYLDSSAQ